MRSRALEVLTVSPSAIGGGAERVALSLHEAYLARGIDSWLALGCSNSDVPRALQIPNDEYRGPWARAVLRRAWAIGERSARSGDLPWVISRALRVAAEPARHARTRGGLEDFAFPATGHILELPPNRPEVLHLHNLHGAYFDVRKLPALAAACQTVLTLHDTWMLTGHCAYPLDCEHWKSGCGDCPYLDVYVPIPRDRSRENCHIKREALAASQLAVATPSRWLMKMAEDSGALNEGHATRVIPNGVDTSVFRPGDQAAARSALHLPQDRRIVVFAGRGIKDSAFKGFETLTEALGIVGSRQAGGDVLFVALGSDAAPMQTGRAELRHVPFTPDSTEVARYYQAADLYVHPARAENLPLAIIEAMACKTPVVASDVGGIPELVDDGRSGLLFEPGNARALADALLHLLVDDAQRHTFAEASAKLVAERFTLEQQVDAYLGWYGELLDRKDLGSA